MLACNQSIWDLYCAARQFQDYLEGCRNFDPEGFARALSDDEAANNFEFRRVIIEAYFEDFGRQEGLMGQIFRWEQEG